VTNSLSGYPYPIIIDDPCQIEPTKTELESHLDLFIYFFHAIHANVVQRARCFNTGSGPWQFGALAVPVLRIPHGMGSLPTQIYADGKTMAETHGFPQSLILQVLQSHQNECGTLW